MKAVNLYLMMVTSDIRKARHLCFYLDFKNIPEIRLSKCLLFEMIKVYVCDTYGTFLQRSFKANLFLEVQHFLRKTLRRKTLVKHLFFDLTSICQRACSLSGTVPGTEEIR